MPKSRKILSQGDRDGACFLYSIANSYYALTKQQLSEAQWKKSINAILFKLDDFLSGRGTEKLDYNPEYLEGLCRKFLPQNNKINFEIAAVKDTTEKSLQKILTNNQVVIAAIDGGNHWVCMVDSDKSQFYLACSNTDLNSEEKYYEATSPNFERPFNKTSSFNELELWGGSMMVVKIVNVG